MDTLKSSQDNERFPLSKSIAPVSTSGMQTMMTGRNGVPLVVPLPFLLLTGACAAALFGLLLPWIAPEAIEAPGFPHVLALVHIATLGWLTMAIIEASLQLTALPILEKSRHGSEPVMVLV
jgi:hypothetical protein